MLRAINTYGYTYHILVLWQHEAIFFSFTKWMAPFTIKTGRRNPNCLKKWETRWPVVRALSFPSCSYTQCYQIAQKFSAKVDNCAHAAKGSLKTDQLCWVLQRHIDPNLQKWDITYLRCHCRKHGGRDRGWKRLGRIRLHRFIKPLISKKKDQ